MDTDCTELKSLEKESDSLSTVIAKLETRLNNLQSSAFGLANYYFVFQGVILTIVCNGAKNLKPSDRWFLFTISILAVSLNLFALILTGIKYVETKGSLEYFVRRRNKVDGNIMELKPNELKKEDKEDEKEAKKRKQRECIRRIYLAVCMILFLSFAVVVLVGCWKFLGDRNEG
ncbi:hypothetical protein ACB098_04G132800 [Castanea mollissima]